MAPGLFSQTDTSLLAFIGVAEIGLDTPYIEVDVSGKLSLFPSPQYHRLI